MDGHATRDVPRRSGGHGDPIGIGAARRDLLLEVLGLHHQLAVVARSNRRFSTADRLLWLFLRRAWPMHAPSRSRCTALGGSVAKLRNV